MKNIDWKKFWASFFSFMRKVITLVIILAPPLYFGFMRQTTEMGLSIIVGAIAAAFLNIDKFEFFKGFGFFEARLRRAVDQAYATIEHMKQVAKPLILSMFSNLTFAGRWDGIPEDDMENIKDKLVNLAKSLEIYYDEEVASAVDLYHHHIIWDKYDRIVSTVSRIQNLDYEGRAAELELKLSALYNRKSQSYPTEKQIRDIFNAVGIQESKLLDEYEEVIQDYLQYLKNHQPGKIKSLSD